MIIVGVKRGFVDGIHANFFVILNYNCFKELDAMIGVAAHKCIIGFLPFSKAARSSLASANSPSSIPSPTYQ